MPNTGGYVCIFPASIGNNNDWVTIKSNFQLASLCNMKCQLQENIFFKLIGIHSGDYFFLTAFSIGETYVRFLV